MNSSTALALLALFFMSPASMAQEKCGFRSDSSAHTLLPLQSALQFQACFGSAKPEIAVDALEHAFQAAKTDPLTHMRSPEAHCFQRAYILMSKFFQLGYRPRLLHIRKAPSLVGLVSNNSPTPTNYYDYHGEHWVVAIDLRLPNGDIEPQILDPQFADRPMSRDDYFRSTTGQSCHTGTNQGPWDCTYEEIAPSSFEIPQLKEYFRQPDVSAHYAWPHYEQIASEITGINNSMLASGNPIPSEILKLEKPDLIREALILKGYEETKKELIDKATNSEKFLKAVEAARYEDRGPGFQHVRVIQMGLGPLIVTDENVEAERKDLRSFRKAIADYNMAISKVRASFRGK